MSTDANSNNPSAPSSNLPAAGPLAAAVRAAAVAAPTAEGAAPVAAAPPAAGTPAPPAGAGQSGGGRPPRGGKQGDRPPRRRRDNQGDGDDRKKPEQIPTFVPPKSMNLGRRGRLSAEMEQEINDALADVSLDALVGQEQPKAADQLERDSRHRSQVIEVHGDDVFFSLGGKAQGVASVRAFAEPPPVGEMVDVVVTGYNAEDDLYNVMVPGGSVVAGDWSEIQEGGIVEAKITAANTGGLECQVHNVRGFIPASQVSLYRTENLGDYVGQKLVCVVTQADERRGNVVLSHRAVLEREKEESKKKLLGELQPGDMRDGVVRKIQDFGAFVDLGSGVDGLIHISQMSWERVKHPGEILTEGQKIRVRIERIDQATGKIGLTLRNPEEHPWANIEQRFPTGAIIKGPVTRIAQFGAFVRIAPGVEGLIHISELAHHKVYRVENVVQEGQEVECKILSMEPEEQRIGLSLKATLTKPEQENKKAGEEAEEAPRTPVVKRQPGPLRGGTNKPSGGDQFGLRW